MCKYVQHRKDSWAEKFLIIQHQLNGLAVPSHTLSMSWFVLSTNPLWTPLPSKSCLFFFKYRQRSCMWCSCTEQVEGTIWMGLENLGYCVPWHAEHRVLRTLHVSLTLSPRLQPRYLRGGHAVFFSEHLSCTSLSCSQHSFLFQTLAAIPAPGRCLCFQFVTCWVPPSLRRLCTALLCAGTKAAQLPGTHFPSKFLWSMCDIHTLD